MNGLAAILERQRDEGLHLGAQLYVSLGGEVVCDIAVGESAPGIALRPDDLMLWYSSSKPLTAMAIAQLVERGQSGPRSGKGNSLALDDLVARFIPGWGGGKERCTVRHVLTHMGGFSRADVSLFDADVGDDEVIATIAASPTEYEPGTAAGYHPSSGWRVLGEIVRVVDGRPIERYLAEEVFAPAGMNDTWMGIPAADQQRLGDRLVPVHWTGHVVPARRDGAWEMREYRIERTHNETWHRAKVEPGGGGRGPGSDLGRFYEAMLDEGRIASPATTAMVTACHRAGVADRTFATKVPWGLGVQVAAGFSGTTGYRSFGHGGMASSRGLCDPVEGLVMVLVANGLASPPDNDRRMIEMTDAVYEAVCPEPRGARLTVRPAAPVLST